MNTPKALIVGTLPYNPSTQSRAMGSYFGFWEENKNAIQIFSSPSMPVHGHCSSFYQITDSMMLRAFFKRKKCVGNVYSDDSLNFSGKDPLEDAPFIKRTFAFAKNNKSPLIRLFRKILWNKKRWLSDELLRWVDDFKPDFVYLAFSNDFFINEIALFFAQKYNIPVITVIGDDYLFDRRFSISIFYHIYKSLYKKLIKRLFHYDTHILYTSKKISDTYKAKFENHSDIIYISSDYEFPTLGLNPTNECTILYAGNLALGRYKSILEIAESLEKIDKNYKIDVYAPPIKTKILRKLERRHSIRYHGSVDYSKLKDLIYSSTLLIITESFEKNDIKTTKYSLSTKVADCLTSGVPIFAYGPIESGCIKYLQDNNACFVCTDKKQLQRSLKSALGDEKLRNHFSITQIELAKQNHTKRKNSMIFYQFVIETLEI